VVMRTCGSRSAANERPAGTECQKVRQSRRPSDRAWPTPSHGRSASDGWCRASLVRVRGSRSRRGFPSPVASIASSAFRIAPVTTKAYKCSPTVCESTVIVRPGFELRGGPDETASTTSRVISPLANVVSDRASGPASAACRLAGNAWSNNDTRTSSGPNPFRPFRCEAKRPARLPSSLRCSARRPKARNFGVPNGAFVEMVRPTGRAGCTALRPRYQPRPATRASLGDARPYVSWTE
jgi:hypothetical protein